jgi:anti-anti-sigma factor
MQIGTGSYAWARPAAGRLVVTLGGEFDIANVPKLEAALEALRRPDDTEVVLDLTTVTFMDARLLRLLGDLHARLRRAGGRMRLRPNAVVQRLLALTELGRVFAVDDQ